MIDIRNTAAMLNYTFVPTIADGKNSTEIAKKLFLKTNRLDQKNPLDFLLSKRMIFEKMKEISFEDLTDFPKLKKKEICVKFFMGHTNLEHQKVMLGI